MITFSHKGNFKKTNRFLAGVIGINYRAMLEKYGQEGVTALSLATPRDTGETANSWSYTIKDTRGGAEISWMNSNRVDGVPIAIILQYGHVTGSGGYVQGIDYINPALKPIFDKIANDVWKGVTTL